MMDSAQRVRKQLDDLYTYLKDRRDKDLPIIFTPPGQSFEWIELSTLPKVSDEDMDADDFIIELRQERIAELIAKRDREVRMHDKPMRAYIEEEIKQWMPHRRI